MVEAKRLRQIIEGKQPGLRGVVPAEHLTAALGGEDEGNVVLTGVAIRGGVGPELRETGELQSRLLACLAGRRGFEALAVIDESSGKGPSPRLVLAFDQNDPVAAPDDDIDGGEGVAVGGDGGLAFGAFQSVFRHNRSLAYWRH